MPLNSAFIPYIQSLVLNSFQLFFNLFRLSQTAVMIWDKEKEDISSIKCNRCETYYSLRFEVLRISNDRLIKDS